MNDTEKESLIEHLDAAVERVEFTNGCGNRIDSLAMHKFYAETQWMEYSIWNAEIRNIRIPGPELADLVSTLEPMVKDYFSLDTGTIGVRFFPSNSGISTFGSARVGSDSRTPSSQLPIKDYANILVLASARIGSERVVKLLNEWLDGSHVWVLRCALIEGVEPDEPIELEGGLRLDVSPMSSIDEENLYRSVLARMHEYELEELAAFQGSTLCIEEDVGPALFSPDPKSDKYLSLNFLSPPRFKPELAAVSIDSLCQVMSLEVDNSVGWFREWKDYGDAEAFFLYPEWCRTRNERIPSLVSISEKQLKNCLEIHKDIERYEEEYHKKYEKKYREQDSRDYNKEYRKIYKRSDLLIGIDRWLRSKWATSKEDQLIDLRIALEAVLLSGDTHGEKQHRLAMRGAWLLGGKDGDRRIEIEEKLRKVYDFASNVIHAETPKKKDEELDRAIQKAQSICKDAILRIAKNGMPNTDKWREIVLGKEFVRREGK